MQIKKSGWLYRIAYPSGGKQPIYINLCSFVRRLMFMVLIAWPFSIVAVIMLCAVTVVLTPIGFLFAQRPAIFDDDTFFVPIKKWPKVTSAEMRVWPLWFVLPALLTWLAYVKYHRIAAALAWCAKNQTFQAWAPVIAIVLALISIAIVLALRLFDSELWQLFKAWYKAKKKKVCPIINVVE